jgi:putative toxin-antitoxin system antitoxin component (TIGR02293 family)
MVLTSKTASHPVSDVLGVVLATSELEAVRQGLPIVTFKQVANYCQLSDAQMSRVVGASGRTIMRLQKENKPLSAAWSDRLYRLARIVVQAETVFEGSQAAHSWLKRPNRALNGQTPVDLLDTDAGTQQVSELLERIEYGVYS